MNTRKYGRAPGLHEPRTKKEKDSTPRLPRKVMRALLACLVLVLVLVPTAVTTNPPAAGPPAAGGHAANYRTGRLRNVDNGNGMPNATLPPVVNVNAAQTIAAAVANGVPAAAAVQTQAVQVGILDTIPYQDANGDWVYNQLVE